MKSLHALIFTLLLTTAAAGGDNQRSAGGTDAWGRVDSFDVVAQGDLVDVLVGREPEQRNGESVFLHARSFDGGQTWSALSPIEVQMPTAAGHKRSNDPRLAASGDRIMAIWTLRGGGAFSSGPLGVALSIDGGRTWRRGPAIDFGDADTSALGMRFPAVGAGPSGFHVAWIHATGNERSLRAAMLPFGATAWSEPVIADPEMCACCWNTMRVSPEGHPFVLYRDKRPSDMALATNGGGSEGWRRVAGVDRFRWHFDGCPHVGGGLAIGHQLDPEARTILASTWTQRPGLVGAYITRSDAGGFRWQRPHMLSLTGRNTDVAMGVSMGRPAAMVVWDDYSAEGSRVMAATSFDDGLTWSAGELLSRPDEYAHHPRVIAAADRFVVYWSVRRVEHPPAIACTTR